MLVTRNGVGTIVSEVDIKTFKDIYELRMRLAELMGDLVAHQSDTRLRLKCPWRIMRNRVVGS